MSACVLLALTMTGCGAGQKAAGPSQKAKNQVNVVATTTQICDYVTQIAAKSADISLDKTDAAGKSSHVGAQKDSAALTMSLTCLLAPQPLRARA